MAEIEIKSVETPAVAPSAAVQRPDHIPEKFWDVDKGEARWEDLAKSYNELSSKLGTDKAADANTNDDTSADDKEAEQNAAAEAAGIDIKAVEAEFVEAGALSDDTYSKFAAAGIDRSVVDEVIQLRVEKAEAVRTELMAPFGGDAGYEKAVEWAGANWSKEQIDTFNAEVNSGDKGKMQLALKALQADFKGTGKAAKPTLLKPTGPGKGADSGVYESLEQLMADQRDPRYGKDPAFTSMVEKKLARSNNI